MADERIKKRHDGGSEAGDAMADIVTATCFLVFSLLMLVGATRFSYQKEMGFVSSAGFTPILLGVLVSVLSVTLIVKTVKKNRSGSLDLFAWLLDMWRNETVRRSTVLIVITGVYIFLVGHAAFLPLTFFFLCAIYYYLKIGTPIKIIIYSLANALLIAFVIPWIYQMPLP